MSEWWTYRAADLLMFAPHTYWRLFELQNQALWPLPVVSTLGFMVLGLGLLRRSGRALRAGVEGMALVWALVAWTFLWQRYAAINPVAMLAAGLFALQALGLLVLAGTRSLCATEHASRFRLGLGLSGWALLYPLQALLAGRPLAQAEVFGMAPDPTAIGCLGLLMCAHVQGRLPRVLLWALKALVLLWCVFSAATLLTMGAWQGWSLLFAAAIALAAHKCRPRRTSVQPTAGNRYR